jgi:hypothetical protein
MVQHEARAHRKDTQRCGSQRAFGEHRHGIEIAADTMLGGEHAPGGRLGCPCPESEDASIVTTPSTE